jgi:translation initiation factor IF-3
MNYERNTSAIKILGISEIDMEYINTLDKKDCIVIDNKKFQYKQNNNGKESKRNKKELEFRLGRV